MPYSIGKLPLHDLLLPVTRASEAIARLDECLAHSPIRDGWIERAHFADAAGCLWLDGELVNLEDLVLHDVHMDVRAPTHELVIAHAVLRTRRQIAAREPAWALSSSGLAELRGRRSEEMSAPEQKDVSGLKRAAVQSPEGNDIVDALDAELAAIDAVIARSQAVLDGAARPSSHPKATSSEDLIYDQDWDEDERLAAWRRVVAETERLPAVLRAVLALDAWNEIEVVQHDSWIGRLFAAAILRESGLARAHLPAINVGLRAVRFERRRSRDRKTRLLALLEGIERTGLAGLGEHERLDNARRSLERKVVGRRSNSKLPQLIDFVLSRPMVSAGMIAKQLKVTQQGAVVLAEELGLREMTGRGRFRAWGVI
ncbi:DUF1612 and helix-turn-helix domain-containing protein [Rhizobium sp. KVB221]|uniref:DUF1612 and helix-turn-helix domain-containing protein n=1 Tax=Rhizobium setariae TaxID=2801340 RepID=A0A936YV57_9HYPH|nr:RHE_PE00001 family protein [Rhizobium setariae]MBL0373767.1 DUF1612 and helix-turn-helix domain-containing protein [Rhizobium setariae]